MLLQNHKILIGSQALGQLGSTRVGRGTDYLVFDLNDQRVFIEHGQGWLVNAANHPFFRTIWEKETQGLHEGSPCLTEGIYPTASPQHLLELAAYAYGQSHTRPSGNAQHADDAAYDMRFLLRKFHPHIFDAPLACSHLSSSGAEKVWQLIAGTEL